DVVVGQEPLQIGRHLLVVIEQNCQAARRQAVSSRQQSRQSLPPTSLLGLPWPKKDERANRQRDREANDERSSAQTRSMGINHQSEQRHDQRQKVEPSAGSAARARNYPPRNPRQPEWNPVNVWAEKVGIPCFSERVSQLNER